MHSDSQVAPRYIDSDQGLADLCQRLASSAMLALDTEFIRTDTFYPIGALLQVADGQGSYLIDPLAITDFQPFIALLENPDITKVLHSCSEDLEVFDRLFQCLPQPLFDTQIAAALDGWGFSLSYQRLVEALLDRHIDKGETRSNWLQRPLTDSQIHYAALDVEYLPQIYQQLQQSLSAKGRDAWLGEECQQLIANYQANSDYSDYYRRVKSAWKLPPAQLALLKKLISWREHMARKEDKPRGRIIKDKSCFELVLKQPRKLSQLAAITDIGPKTVRKYGEQLLDMLEEHDKALAQNAQQSDFPPALPKPLPADTRNLAKVLKSHVRKKAEQLQLAEEMLARKKDYEQLIRSGLEGHYQLPNSLSGWRKAVIGDELLQIAENYS